MGFYACKDIIMPDLKGQKVAINSPLQNQTIRNYNVTFWWNPLEGAALYRFQVVQNRFDSLPIFRLDSTTTKTQITVTLKPGLFQWRLWAENGINRSDTITRLLKVDSASIREQIIKIRRPSLLESFVNLKGNPYRIQWEQLPGARRYQIEVNNDTTKFSVANYYDLSFSTQMEYNIRVRAIGSGEKTGWSEYYRITYDITPPGPTTIRNPANNFAVITQLPLTLEYESGEEATRYVLNFYKNSNTNYILRDTVSTTSYILDKADYTKSDTIRVQVTGLDRANNASLQPDERKILFKK